MDHPLTLLADVHSSNLETKRNIKMTRLIVTTEFERSRSFARLILALLVGSLVIYRDVLDNAVSALWTSLKVHPLFLHDSFEPLLASASFASWIWIYYFIDKFQLMEGYRIHADAPHDTDWNLK